MATTPTAFLTSVIPTSVGEEVCCGACGARMDPFLWRSVDGTERSLFWRCSEDTDHVTLGMPLGHLRICA